MRKFILFNGDIFEVAGDVADPIDALKRALKEAREAGFTDWVDRIPQKYLKNRGISMNRIFIEEFKEEPENQDNEVQKYRLCCANECSAYDGGTCWRYGGTCCGRYTGDDLDCIHGTGGKILTYLGDVIANVPVETDLGPKQFAREIWTGTDAGILKDGIRGILEENPYALDGYPEDICSGIWEFKADD